MEAMIGSWIAAVAGAHPALIFLWIVVMLAILGKGADILVDEAVLLAERSGIPKVVVGATVVSLGTTTPETSVSVLAALQGDPGLALGNAVGSIICDTGLILGIACLISPPPLDRSVVNRQGWIQFGAGALLVVLSFLFGSRLPRGVGFLFLALLGLYIWLSIRWSARSQPEGDSASAAGRESLVWTAAKLVFGVCVVLVSSKLLIPAVGHATAMFHIPPDIIAATLVAVGTSLPELVTAVTASLKRHGEVALGNVIGADILNVLFVSGAAIAVTPGGLEVPVNFFKLHYPFMLAILLFFRVGIHFSGATLGRPFGAALLGLYAVYLILQPLFVG